MTVLTTNAPLHCVEITTIPPLSPGELSLLDMHSVVNVLTVLRNEVAILGLVLADDEDHFANSLAVCDHLLEGLSDRDASLDAARGVEQFEEIVIGEIDAPCTTAANAAARMAAAETIANIRSVFGILRVRAREILARAADPERWAVFDVAQLASEFRKVFAAIEQNSKGSYRILFNPAQQGADDYYVDLRLEAPDGCLRMPPVFHDVMRDLIANARKYTLPGGHITAGLYEDAEALHFVVKDNGCGIPAEEVPKVVEYGRRGSNVGGVRTMGAGFGLTKAFLVTKQFGGRMWIASAVDHGTSIRIRIPLACRS
jgi:signal transduction histidine kinase